MRVIAGLLLVCFSYLMAQPMGLQLRTPPAAIARSDVEGSRQVVLVQEIGHGEVVHVPVVPAGGDEDFVSHSIRWAPRAGHHDVAVSRHGRRLDGAGAL